MFRTIGLHLALAAPICFATTSNAIEVEFARIDGAASANDISPDGRWVVGERTGDIGGGTYLLDTTTMNMTPLPPEGIAAVAVSDDGTVVLGNVLDPDSEQQVAAIWDRFEGVWNIIGALDPEGCGSLSSAYELSGDGTVACGLSWDGCLGVAFRWTEATGMVQLDMVGVSHYRASVMSADGNLMGGFAQGSFSRTPAFWSWDGINDDAHLLDPPNGDALGEVHGISDDSTVMLGTWDGAASTWSYPGLVRSQIGDGSVLPGWEGIPMDIADDDAIVGFDVIGLNRRAWIKPAGAEDMISIADFVEGNGGSIPDGISPQVCQAISSDGRVIIGHGGFDGGWIVRINDGCPGDVAPGDGDGILNFSDVLAVLTTWGPCVDCPTDFAPEGGDGVVNFQEVLIVLTNWGLCPASAGACCVDGACTLTTEMDCASSGGVFLGTGIGCTSFACDDNDHCVDAVDITDHIDSADPVEGDNSSATPAWGVGNDDELPAGSPSCHHAGEPTWCHSTVWYSFVAPETGTISISLCGSEFPFADSTLALYEGDCSKLTQIACDDDSCDVLPEYPYHAVLSASGLVPGDTYYVCVMNSGDGFVSVPGRFRMDINE